jgi:hypothetical protein
MSDKASPNYESRSVTAGVALAKAFDVNPTTPSSCQYARITPG